jgi:hypothetical protein
MEVYILDNLLRRVEIIDRFESLIWTERWASWGDFEMSIRSSFENRSLLKSGVQLALDRSYRVMTIETVEDDANDQGIKVLKIKGRSIEMLFEDRVTRSSKSSLSAFPTWDITGTPGFVMRRLVQMTCVFGVMSIYDKIPFIIEGRHPSLPADTIAEPIDPITVNIEPKSVYEAITSLSNTWTLGFRLLRDGDLSKLYFDVYSGVNRTSSQVIRPAVVFAPELDNLQNTTEMSTIEGAKNVAYVIAENGFMEVVALGVDIEVEGFERRVLVVNASDITLAAGAPLDAAMLLRGKEALSEHRAFQAFDGEINQNSQYNYNVDYYLGDLVEIRNTDGIANHMRVTEQIFVHDKEGEREYPTLVLNTFVNTGSWLSWESNKQWIDYDADVTTTWATLP